MKPPPQSDSRSDAKLVDALNEGELAAFEAIYYRYRDWAAGLATRFAGNADDALDVLQETFAYFHRKFPGFVLSARLTTFFYPVVKNLSIAARRKRGRFAGDDAALNEIPAPQPASGDDGDLAAVLSILPGIHRETLLMRFVDGMSIEEIAQAMRIATGTVKSRLHNALETLRADPRTARYFGDC